VSTEAQLVNGKDLEGSSHSLIKLLLSTHEKGSDFGRMHMVPYLWAILAENKNRSCQNHKFL